MIKDNFGLNNLESSNYAKRMLNEDGTGYLENIVDIAAGTNTDFIIENTGLFYVLGNGADTQLGVMTTTYLTLPKKVGICNAIQATIGDKHLVYLTGDGIVNTVGKNNYRTNRSIIRNTSYCKRSCNRSSRNISRKQPYNDKKIRW